MLGCSCCVVPPEVDADLFDGRAFCETVRTSGRGLSLNACNGEAKDVLEPIEETGADLFTEERRNVVARGMKRFEIEKFPPPQPDFEKTFLTWFCSVLGQKPERFLR